MNTIWLVLSHNGIETRYGWFEKEGDCENKCAELRKFFKIGNPFFRPFPVVKN
jgi:hypothetical protein